MSSILTNEWTPVGVSYPPAGRVVLCVKALPTRLDERNSMMYVLARWNGSAWLLPDFSGVIDSGDDITHWYMFERYFDHGDESGKRQ